MLQTFKDHYIDVVEFDKNTAALLGFAVGATLVGTLFSLVAGGIFGTLGGYFGRTVKERH